MGEKTATATPFLNLTLKLTRELHARDHRVVDEAGQVVEVDAAREADLVQTVAAIGRHFITAVVPAIAGA